MRESSLPIALSIVIAGAIIGLSLFFALRANAGAQVAQAAGAPHGSPVSVEIRDSDPQLGDKAAPATLIAFEDFECPFCGRFSRDTLPLLAKNEIKSGKLRVVWKDFPLSIHSHAARAHEAARCAQSQGKFWEYHNLLFDNQSALSESDLKGYASRLGLDRSAFDACLASGEGRSLVEAGQSEGFAAGVSGTPSFVLNGTMIAGALPYQTFAQAIAHIAQ